MKEVAFPKLDGEGQGERGKKILERRMELSAGLFNIAI